MRDDGKDLKAMRIEAGEVPVMEIARDLDLHWQTIYRALDGKGGPKSVKKIRNYLRGKIPTKTKATA